MKQILKDYGIHLKQVPLYCDNESAIKIANNPVQHSKTKHIEIHHHFLKDHVMKEDVSFLFSALTFSVIVFVLRFVQFFSHLNICFFLFFLLVYFSVFISWLSLFPSFT